MTNTKFIVDFCWFVAGLVMFLVFFWGFGWSLDDEENQVKAGKKLPGTTILPIVNHAQSCAQ